MADLASPALIESGERAAPKSWRSFAPALLGSLTIVILLCAWQLLPQLITISPGTRLFFTTPSRIAITLWNMSVRQVTATLKGYRGEVSSVAFSPDGNTLASASSDGAVRLWRAASLREADPLQSGGVR